MARDDDWDGVKAHNDTLSAVRAERERCAKIVEEFHYGEYHEDYKPADLAQLVAAAIRAAITAGKLGT